MVIQINSDINQTLKSIKKLLDAKGKKEKLEFEYEEQAKGLFVGIEKVDNETLKNYLLSVLGSYRRHGENYWIDDLEIIGCHEAKVYAKRSIEHLELFAEVMETIDFTHSHDSLVDLVEVIQHWKGHKEALIPMAVLSTSPNVTSGVYDIHEVLESIGLFENFEEWGPYFGKLLTNQSSLNRYASYSRDKYYDDIIFNGLKGDLEEEHFQILEKAFHKERKYLIKEKGIKLDKIPPGLNHKLNLL